MVDYHRSPLLVVNKLPRILELEVDDLQPDRMNKLSVDFNFGTASITYIPKKDPNKYSEIPLKEPGVKFKDHPAGFIDPSVEEFKVVVALGGKNEEITMKTILLI